MLNPRVSGAGNAKLSTAFDVNCYSQIYFAICIMKHGSGSLMDPKRTAVLQHYSCVHTLQYDFSRTVNLTGTELAHQAHAAVARGIS
jgi:hypothetical protein